MNPEFERNLWLEMTPRRVVMMPVVVGLIILAATAVGSKDLLAAAGQVGKPLYYFLVILWGTRTAAGAIASEIQGRTWDFQRLSALTPWQLLTGKLFGATSYQWYGGLICLVFVALNALRTDGLGVMLAELIYLLSVGLFAQSIAMFASLLAVHRRASLRRLDVFLFQIAGLAAALIADNVWNVTYVAGLIARKPVADSIEHFTWWDLPLPLDGFYLVSLLVFLGWSVVGNLTLLRGELQMRTGPLPWIAFLIFCVCYTAGFADAGAGAVFTTTRLAIAIVVTAALTYAAILFEHKDPVLYRWLLGAFAQGRIDKVLGGLQSWMSALLLLTALVIYFELTFTPPLKEVLGFTQKLAPAVIAGFAFVLRDIGVFLYFNMGPKRGDFGALVSLALLYVILPAMVAGFQSASLIGLFYPNPDANSVVMIAAPALEAAAIWMLAGARLRRLLKPMVESAPR
jgi:hypothetical protein